MSTYTINVSFQTRVNKTTRTLEIAESFGLGLDEKDWTLYDNLELEVEQGDVVYITGLLGYWIHQNQERLRLGIPFYRIANGDVIRFSIEELFLWEMHHLRPCRYPMKGNAAAP